MNCKITRNAAKVLKLELDKPENEGKNCALSSHMHMVTMLTTGLISTHQKKMIQLYLPIKRLMLFLRMTSLC